jgi:putative ABC transport system permease protein
MRLRDLISFALKAMSDRKLRSVLTILGIVIGPATIVALVAATQGFSDASTSQFSKLGATSIFVSPVGRTFTLSSADVSSIQSLSGVKYAIPYYLLTGRITQGGQTVSVQIYALDLSQLSEIFPTLTLGAGSLPSASDLSNAAVGYSIAYPGLSGATNITVNGVVAVSNIGTGGFFGPEGAFSSGSSASGSARTFIASGIFDSFGQGFGINPDSSIFIPLDSGETLLHRTTYSGIAVIATNTSAVSNVMTELSNTYGQNVRATSVSSIISSIQSVSSGTSTLLTTVGAISVLVAFIGIMTTMFTSVLERTKEIGVMKALGASSRTVMMNFVSEAFTTGLLGGLVGAGLGAGLSYLVIDLLQGGTSSLTLGAGTVRFAGGAARAASSPSPSTLSISPALSPELLLLAIGLATLVGTLAGVLPAWRASRLTPVESLRST